MAAPIPEDEPVMRTDFPSNFGEGAIEHNLSSSQDATELKGNACRTKLPQTGGLDIIVEVTLTSWTSKRLGFFTVFIERAEKPSAFKLSAIYIDVARNTHTQIPRCGTFKLVNDVIGE
jgi:hypothetical protein